MGFYVVVGLTKLMYITKSWTDSDCILRLITKVTLTDVQPLNLQEISYLDGLSFTVPSS